MSGWMNGLPFGHSLSAVDSGSSCSSDLRADVFHQSFVPWSEALGPIQMPPEGDRVLN